jgi:hypothetical protein
VEAPVRAQFEHLVVIADTAADSAHPESLSYMRAYAAGAIQTMISLRLVTTEEAGEWRARLSGSLGPEFGKRARFYITSAATGGDAAGVPSRADAATVAYTMCRDLSLEHLALQYDTAAQEDAIAAAVAGEYPDEHERILRACRFGFADRGKPVVEPRDL